MKYVQIISACDMTRAETGKIAPADETLYLALGSDPATLEVRELDLAAEWAKELREFLEPYLDASHEPGDLVTPVSGSGDTVDKRQYKKNLVAWAQQAGYDLTKLKRGGWYAPAKTKRAYALHLAGRDEELTEANGLQPDRGPATGNSV